MKNVAYALLIIHVCIVNIIINKICYEKSISFTEIATNTEINKDFITEKDNQENLIQCEEDEILKGACKGKITKEQINIIFEKLKNEIQENKITNQIIETQNAIFQISTYDEQKENDNPTISSIDLGECEKILKNKEHLSDQDDLIIIKVDEKGEGLYSTSVRYEIFNPKTYKQISTEDCINKITIYIPVNHNEDNNYLFDDL